MWIFWHWHAPLAGPDPATLLTVAFLDVGQGDALFIESPSGYQVLVDAGPPGRILPALKKVMKWYDRTIDMVIITNPDNDHIGGFVDVFDVYRVDTVLKPGTQKTTEIFTVVEQASVDEHAAIILARAGQVYDLGEGVTLTILFPDYDVSDESANEGSIVARLSYGDIDYLLTGDAPNKILEHVAYVASTTQSSIQSEVLKAGHHGSRTSASETFLAAVAPWMAIISAGKDNKYKHPHSETLDALIKYDVEILGTYEQGTIITTTDGASIFTEK